MHPDQPLTQYVPGRDTFSVSFRMGGVRRHHVGEISRPEPGHPARFMADEGLESQEVRTAAEALIPALIWPKR